MNNINTLSKSSVDDKRGLVLKKSEQAKEVAETIIDNKEPVLKNGEIEKQQQDISIAKKEPAFYDTYSRLFFLKKGGEMGAIIRGYNWAQSSLGTPDLWPQTLLTVLGIMLTSKFPMFLWWGEDLIQFYNDAYRPSLGNNGKHPSALGQKGEDCWPEIWPVIKPLIDQVLSGGEATWSEDQLIPIYRNGQLENVYWTFSHSAVSDETGKVCGVLVTCTETTKKVNLFNLLKVSDERFQNLVQKTSMAIMVVMGEEFVVNIFNEPYAKLLGHSVEAMIGKPLFTMIPHTEESFRPKLENVMRTGEGFDDYGRPFTYYIKGAEKHAFFDVIYQPYKETDGRVTGVIVLVHDVTENTLARKEMANQEMALQKVTEHLASIVQFSEDAIISKSLDGTIQSWNAGAEKMFGYTAEECIGKNITLIRPPELVYEEKLLLEKIQNGKTIDHYETIRIKKSGERMYVTLTESPLKDKDGNLIGISKIVRDITAQKKYEEDLITANKELAFQSAEKEKRAAELAIANKELVFQNEEKEKRAAELELVNKELESFSYSVSHDLRSPLRAINGFTKILLEDYMNQFDEDAKSLLNEVIENSDRMGELIDNLLTFSRLGKQHVSSVTVYTRQLVDTVITELKQLEPQRIFNISIKNLVNIEGDRNMIKQVFINLISNAFKYTGKKEEPVIEIGSYRQNDQQVYYVKDNGAGFDMLYYDKLFGVFQRLHSSNEFDGTGVGLAIIQKIITKHQGKVWAEGKVNEGACFYFSMPVSK